MFKFSTSKSWKRLLTIILAASMLLHLVALLVFGAYKIVEDLVRDDPGANLPDIDALPQREPEYVINLDVIKAESRERAREDWSPSSPTAVPFPKFESEGDGQ